MIALNNTPDDALKEIAPVLDEAINQLGAEDRAAILRSRDTFWRGFARRLGADMII